MDKEYPTNEAGELVVEIGTPSDMPEKKAEETTGLKVNTPSADMQLYNGSITSDIKLNTGADKNVDAEQDVLAMDNLSLSNPVKYLATYNSPHEWILDQREAEAAQWLRDTAIPEQTSKVGTIAYSAGEFLRKTANMGRDFSEYAAGVNAYLLPNANKEVAQRAYKNMKKLSVETEQTRADYVAKHGVDPDVYGIATNVMEVARDMVLTAGVAGAAKRGITKAAYGYATRRLAPTATDVAARFAEQQGKRAATNVAKTAIAGETFVREAGDRSTQQVAQYMDATGDYDLKYYDPTVDLALNTGVSAINSAIEMSLGIERAVPDMIFGTRSVGRFAEEFIRGYVSERGEEFFQNFFDQGSDVLSGYRDNISLAQAWSDSAAAGWIGGIFGSGTSAGMYYLNRRRMIRQLQEDGIEKDLATKFVDKVLQDGINKTLNNMSSTIELRTKEGPAYEKMKTGIKNALLIQGWNEKMVDPQTGEVRNIDSYVETFINKDVINKAISEALSSGLSIDDWLDVAQFTAIDNVLYVRPLGTVEDIQKRIDEQDAIIKRQTELKKTGADKPGVLQEARTAKAILQKLKANKLLDGEIERVSIEEAKTPEIVKEIDTATTDAAELGKANTAADFVGNIEGTDEEKTKRLGNAVMKRIFKDDKRGFDAVMTKPEYANVRAAINSSAAKIFDYIKAHRAYGVAKDLYDALKLLPTVKSGNFISTVNTPDLTGQDPVARNAFLYNFVFNDAHATSAFIDAYLIRAEESITNQTKVRLGKKDLVGQAFKAMDALMQTQADVAGLQYTSIYNEDGSVADPNVAAVVASWQNLFVEVPEQRRLSQQFLEQFDLADENARLDEIYPPYDGDTIEVDGRIRPVYNSEGERINESAEALRNFWRWFGDSKVVDEQGRPLVLYHGTKSEERFDTFAANATWGTPDKTYANTYRVVGTDLYTIYFKTENPAYLGDINAESSSTNIAALAESINATREELDNVIDSIFGLEIDEFTPIYDITNTKEFENLARTKGFDGFQAIEHGDNGNVDTFAVFEPTQIKSVENLGYYNAQDPRMLYQPSYVSLKGELIGDYIDADLHLGRGDNTRVWLWGNYMLLNEKIDKEHYFDRFEKEGPRLTYEGKEITPEVLDELGFSNEFYVTDQIRGNLMDYARSILYTKEDLISSTEKYLKQYEDVHKYYLKRATDRLVRRGWDRKEVKQMVKDMEAIALGEEGWASVALNFNKGTPEYEIQKKYRDSEGRLDDKFTELYVELTKEFDEIESQFRSYNGFIGSVRRVDAIRKALDAIKKMDWNKLGGRTGFAYKGESFTGILSQIIADTGLYEYDRNDVFYRVDKKLRRTLKEKKDIQAALKSLDEEYTKFTELVPSANKAIEEIVDKYKDDYPAADPKAVVDAIEKYMVKPQTPLRGFAPSLIIFNEGNLSPADDDLLRKVAGSRESGIELPDWEYKDNKPTIADIVARIKTAETRLAILRHVQNFFKDATNADFDYKPMATMVETEAPENYELLNASRPLDRQPKQVQQAIIDTIREYAPKYPELHLEDNLYSGIGRTLNDEQARMFSKMFDIDLEVSNAFLQDEVERKVGDAELEQVPDDLWTTMYEAIDYALTMKENPKFSDIIDGLKKRRKYIEENGYFNYHKDLQQKHFIIIDYLLDQANKQPKKTPVSEFTKELSNFKGVELHDNNAFKFLDRLNSYMNLNPDVYESLKKDTSLGLTQNPPTDEIIIKMFRKHGIKGLKYYGHRDKRGVVTWQKTPVTRLLYSLDTYDDLTTTDSVGSVTNILQQLKDGSHERLLFDTRNNNWYLADADKMVHADMFVRAFRQGNYPEFNNEREAEQYFQENYLSDDPTLLQFLATKYDSPADAKQAMEHTLGTDEYTHAYLRDGLVVFARSESDLRDSGFPVEQFDHYKAEYDENNNRQIVLVEQPTQGDGRSLDADYRWQPINPKSVMPNVRGGWTKEKILRYLKSWGSHFGAVKAVKEISNFDSVEDFKNHVFYHGARYGTSGSMSPSITMSDRKIGNIGGGGYGEKYWAISVTKSKRVAGNFATAMDDGNIYPILLAKNAKVIEMPELTDSADLENHIVDLYNQGVDAVWIGDKNAGEQELAVINPRAIINIGKADFYRAFRLGSEENPIRMKTDKDFETIFEFAKDYRNKDEETRVQEAREMVYWQGRRTKINGMYDPELGTILIGKNFNGTTLPHEMAHYWLDTIFKVFKQAQAGKLNVRPEWMAQKREMFAMLGINENQTSLTRGQQEKFATMLEAYISGVGVTNEITRTFNDYLKWVPEKYRNLQQLSYVDENGKIQNVFLDAKAVEFFNRWYENPSLPSLSTSPERQRFMNVSADDGTVIRVSIKEVNDREKEFAQDAEEQLHTDQRLYNTLDENMPADIKPVADAQKVVISERGNFLKATEEEQKKIITPDDDRKRRWFERKSRETEAQLAQEYIEKNPEHAHEVIFGDPELIPNDTGIDRATLINTYMATNGITEDKPEWAQLHTNIAINQSMAGTQLALSNDKSYRTYLDALREIEEALELKAATNYAGASVGARERFNSDIQQFLSKELPAVFATEAGSKEREIALKQMFEKARTTFSGNTTGRFLTQMDMEYAKAQKRKTDAFVKWAEKVIKTQAGAKLNAEQQAHLLKISAKAQQALTDIDSKDAGVAVAGALELRKWQLEKQKLMGVAPKKFSIFGDYAPRAMLASPNTLLFANIPSTAINTLITNLAKRGDLFGENKVSEKLIKDEIKRIKAIYGSTAMNLAQMEKPTSPTLLHGEKYSASGQKWYDPYTILGREDNFFRVPTFVNTLARIASKDAKATGRSADEVFLEYIKLNDQSDSAKLARKQALAVANMAVFTQNGALARCLNHIRSELNYLSRAPLGLDPHGFGLGSLIAPFLSTGANIAEMGIRGTIAPIVTLTTYAQALRTGKAIDPLKKLALRMDWTYFVFSAVCMALLAALTSDDDEFYIDPYKAGMGYDPDRPYDSINIGGVWVDIDFFGPFAIPMRTAAKVIQAWKKDNGVGTSLGMGYAESAKSVLGDIPLAESIINNQFEWAMKKPGAFAGSYVYNQGNKLVPAFVKPISRALSRGQGWMLRPFEGTTVGRKFNRNYGFDGQELTSQDLLEMFTIKFQLGPDAQQYLNNILGLQ